MTRRKLTHRAHPTTRAFVLQTTFPSKVLDDAAQTVEEAKLQNAVVVQRYT
jgi:UBX domain-containing protein 1